MKFKHILFYLIFLIPFFSCTDMNIPPKNIIGDDDIFGSEAGVMSQLARMYSTLPMEDFKYNMTASGLFHKDGVIYSHLSCLTGEAIGRDTRQNLTESVSYWDGAYQWIRDVNTFIETLPKYAENHSAENVQHWLGEAYFIRAYIYMSLVKRYGGVPLVKTVIDYPGSVSYEETMLYRDSEEDTWDFIAEDLDRAYEMLPDSNQKGRVDKSAAAALKSRAMLHAGCIAKYNNGNGGDASRNYNDPKTGKQIMGIPEARAKDYFKQAYDATLLVSSAYGLQESASSDWEAMVDNYASIFKTDTKETIFARYYDVDNAYHQFDNTATTKQTNLGGNDSDICPTLDFVEMFEFPYNVNGKFENRTAEGYKLFDSPLDVFENCEPRLAAIVILPMSQFKGRTIDIRRGIWKGESAATMAPLMNESENYSQDYAGKFGSDDRILMANGFSNNTTVDIGNGQTMLIMGESGITSGWDFGNISGFYQRKYLTDDINHSTTKSSTTWIEIRYAEVLLNRAEAAWELVSLGESAGSDGRNYLDVATECVNMIRRRAGATELASNLTDSVEDRDVIRKERRKELAFENKTYWDLKRWRIRHNEQNNIKYRTIAPFYSVVDGKYFIDIKYQESRGQGTAYIANYNVIDYYQAIPQNEINRNPNCEQNDGY